VNVELVAAIRERLLSDPPLDSQDPRGSLERRIRQHLEEMDPLIGPDRTSSLLTAIVRDLDGFGALEELFADPEVSEIMLNRPGSAFVERAGRVEPLPLDLGATQIVQIAERAIVPLGLRLDRTSPIVDARLADGSRIHAVLPPLAVDGPCVTIRRFRPREVTLAEFDVPEAAEHLLRSLVRGGANVLVSGGTSAGKTTLLNVLARAIDEHERIVTIEETAELSLAHPHVVRLEARPPNAEGVGAVSVRELVKAALRMRPDRIVVGEVRAGEALDMLQALNTGHDGSLCTVHANDAAASLVRVETLALFGAVDLPILAIRRQVVAAIDIVVHVERCRDGRRRVQSIAEVVRDDDQCGVRLLADRRDGRLEVIDEPTRPRGLR
jgi:pilus assembly protein CpaF